VLTVTKSIKEMTDVRTRASAEREQRAHNAFLSTPWWDQYVRDAIRAGGPGPVR